MRTIGKKETYKYLRILVADIIVKVEMKEKIKTTQNRAEISSKR